MKASNMNLRLILFVFALFPFSAAEGQNTSATPWEHLPSGIAVKLELRGSKITAYLINESNSPKMIVGAEDHLVQFFYLDDSGTRVQLGYYPSGDNDVDGSSERKQSASAPIPKKGAAPLQIGIDLTPEEVKITKTHPVMCATFVQDSETKACVGVESSPKRLISEK